MQLDRLRNDRQRLCNMRPAGTSTPTTRKRTDAASLSFIALQRPSRKKPRRDEQQTPGTRARGCHLPERPARLPHPHDHPRRGLDLQVELLPGPGALAEGFRVQRPELARQHAVEVVVVAPFPRLQVAVVLSPTKDKTHPKKGPTRNLTKRSKKGRNLSHMTKRYQVRSSKQSITKNRLGDNTCTATV